MCKTSFETLDAPSVPSFDDRLAVMADVLSPAQFGLIADEIERLPTTERSYLPTHKKGGAVAYDTRRLPAPDGVALYQ